MDRFFGVAQWLVEHEKAVVQHIDRQASDHCMLILDIKPKLRKKKRRFYFDKRWIGKSRIEEIMKKAWDRECIESLMFKVACKIKRCRMDLLKWNRKSQNNSAAIIQKLKEEMEELDTTYKDEEMY